MWSLRNPLIEGFRRDHYFHIPKLGENLQEMGHMTHIDETNFVYAYKRQVISIEGVHNRART